MKKEKIIACMAATAMVVMLGLAGCAGSQPASSSATPSSSATASASATTSSSAAAPAASSSSAAAPAASSSSAAAPAASSSAAAPAASSSAAAPAANNYIGEDSAKNIALQHAGIAEPDTYELKVELDLDDAVIHYDVDFKSNGMEYDYDINATTGEIIFSKSEVDD